MDQSNDMETRTSKPRKSRQPKAERRVVIYRMIDGKQKEQGTFPDTTIGDPMERRLPAFLSEMFGPGEYKVDTRNARGRFEESHSLTIAESEPEPTRERIIDIELEDDDDDEPGDQRNFDTGQMSRAEVENMLLRDELKRLKDGAARQGLTGQSEMQTLINALEQSRQEQRDLMMLMITQAQRPQQDATTQAMNILEKSLGIVTKAKAISEEIAPSDQGGSGGSGGGFMADSAKLIDSLGRNAATFLPLLGGLIPKAPIIPTPQASRPTPPVSGEPSGELSDLASKIREKNTVTAEASNNGKAKTK